MNDNSSEQLDMQDDTLEQEEGLTDDATDVPAGCGSLIDEQPAAGDTTVVSDEASEETPEAGGCAGGCGN